MPGVNANHLVSKLTSLVLTVTAAFWMSSAAAFAEDADDQGGHGERSKILQWLGYEEHTTSRITDDRVVAVDPDVVPDRPLRLELGNAFVGTGPISKGFVLPTGATWTPSLLIFGSMRTAIQYYDTGRPNQYTPAFGPNGNQIINGASEINPVPNALRGLGGIAALSVSGDRPVPNHAGEWANRLDVHANLILSGTERIVASLRPLDEGFTGPNALTGRFTGYYFGPGHGDFKKEFNADLINLFFEMDVGELFPNLDPEDKLPLDISITVGRQQFFYQEGILIFDFMDGVGISKNSIRLPGTSNLQISALWAWDEINRGSNFEVKNTDLFGLFFALDTPFSTINFDTVYTHDFSDLQQDGLYFGLSFVQRIWKFSTAFRVVSSIAVDRRASFENLLGQPLGGGARPLQALPTSVVDTGVVLFGEIGYTPAWTRNQVYATFFWGINDFTPAARMPGVGGPMGRAGLNFAGQGLGRFAAPLPNFAQDVVGGALGYQMILDGPAARRQLVFELGGRHDTNGDDAKGASILARFQQAVGQRFLLQADLFGRTFEDRSPGWGGRIEWRTNF